MIRAKVTFWKDRAGIQKPLRMQGANLQDADLRGANLRDLSLH